AFHVTGVQTCALPIYELRARRRVLAEGLAAIPGVEWTPTRGGLFAFARIAGCTDSMRLSQDLVEQVHVVTIPGAVFGASGEGHLDRKSVGEGQRVAVG